MKRVILHAKRIIRKFWIFLLLVCAGSPLIGIPVFALMLSISLLFFGDPIDIDEKALLEYFTKEELDALNATEIDESISDEDFLELYARMQNFICPQRVDRATVLKRVSLANDAYIYEYDLNEQDSRVKDNYEVELKKEILSNIDRKDVRTMRMIRSKRNFIYRYWNTNSDGYKDIVITPEELNS